MDTQRDRPSCVFPVPASPEISVILPVLGPKYNQSGTDTNGDETADLDSIGIINIGKMGDKDTNKDCLLFCNDSPAAPVCKDEEEEDASVIE
jgi:hypothetical protein